MALLVKLRAEAPEVVLLPGTLGRRMKANGRPAGDCSNHRARPPACRAFQMATIRSASAVALRSTSARLALAAALAAARSRSCARRLGPIG